MNCSSLKSPVVGRDVGYCYPVLDIYSGQILDICSEYMLSGIKPVKLCRWSQVTAYSGLSRQIVLL